MKKILFFALALSIGNASFAQQKTKVSYDKFKNATMISQKTSFSGNENIIGISTPNETVASNLNKELTQIGSTVYDLQTNKSLPPRLLVNDDNSISAVWTQGFSSPAFADRGTGYNYSANQGTTWNVEPATRLESLKTGWPNIIVQNGKEIVIAHMATGLTMISRDKGTGTWGTTTTIPGSTNYGQLMWPRAMSIGTNEIIGMATNGDPVDTTIYLFKSNDGGNTFTYFVPEGLDTTIWCAGNGVTTNNGGVGGVTSDGYTMDVRGDIIAFVVGDMDNSVWLFKSTDKGNTFTRKEVFHHPINRWKVVPGAAGSSDWNKDGVDDTLTSHDGYLTLVIDNNGMCHVAGGYVKILRTALEQANYYSNWPGSDGIWYWNETQKPIFVKPADGSADGSGNFNKQLDSSFTVASCPDLNNDGELNIPEILKVGKAYSFTGLSTMPYLNISDEGHIALLYSAINESTLHSESNIPYRSLFMKIRGNDGVWLDTTIIVSEDLYAEQVYSMGYRRIIKENNNYYIHILYQTDSWPGTFIQSPPDIPHPAENNYINYNKIDISYFINLVGINKNDINKIDEVKNYPNPSNGKTTFSINLNNQANVEIKIADLMGKIVYETPITKYGQGRHEINIDVTKLNKGVYIYTVKADNYTVSNKMVID